MSLPPPPPPRSLWSRISDVPRTSYNDSGSYWRARALRIIMLGSMVLMLLGSAFLLVSAGPTRHRKELNVTITFWTLCVILYWLTGKGMRGLAVSRWLFVPCYFALVAGGAFMGYGVFDPSTLGFYTVILVSALLMEAGEFLLVTAAVVVGVVLLPGSSRPVDEFALRAYKFSAVVNLAACAILVFLFRRLQATMLKEAVQAAKVKQEIETQAKNLAELDTLKTTFLANVSHEFRTPLTLSLGLIDESLDAADPPLSPVQRDRLLEMRRQDQRLLKLINTLLTFSRIEAGRSQGHFEPVDLAALTTDLCSQFRSALERAGLRLLVDCPPLGETVYVDRDMWEMIVLNLLSNAFKFTLEGQVEVTLRTLKDKVEMWVRDTGVGIAEQDLPQLFQRFHQLRARRARSQEGTGIGLALVHDLVELHKGSIRASSVLGKGTTFTVTLPLGHAHLPAEQVAAGPSAAGHSVAQAFVDEAAQWLPGDTVKNGTDDATAASGDRTGGLLRLQRPVTGPSLSHGVSPDHAAGESGPTVQCPGAHILLVDDNPDLRRYLRRLLGMHWSISEADNGEEALRLIREQKALGRDRGPDLVLSDVMMPVLSGIELVRKLRQDPELRYLPVMLVSARADEDSAVTGLAAGANDYLVKPFLPRELVARIGVHLLLSRNSRETVKTKEQSLGRTAHELRAPLSIFKGYTDILKLRLVGAEPVVVGALPKMESSVRRMEELINDLMDAARMESGQLVLKRERCDLRALCIAAVDEEESLAGHEVTLAAPEREVMIDGDGARLTQVLVNLLRNAFKYAGTEQPVELHLNVEGDQALVTVRDRGPGIAPEHQRRIFESFYKVADSEGHRTGGLGLGLYICKELIEGHGGRIWVESTPGQGCAFRFGVPMAASNRRP